MLSIFEKFDDGNNILDQNEINNIKSKLLEYASEDNEKNTLSKDEAKNLIKNLGLKTNVKDLFKFLTHIKTSSANIKSCNFDNKTKNISIEYNDNISTTEVYDNTGKLIHKIKESEYDNNKGKLTVNTDGTLTFECRQKNALKIGDTSFNMTQDVRYEFKSQQDFESIKTVTKENVVLINPWNPAETITMSRSEFVQKALSVTLAKIPYQQMDDTTNTDNDGTDSPAQQNTPVNPDNNIEPTPNPDNKTVRKVKIQKNQGYNDFIKNELAKQGITDPTPEQITKAKSQFEAANPRKKGSKAYVHVWNQNSHPEWKGNKYLIAGLEYKVPKFNV